MQTIRRMKVHIALLIFVLFVNDIQNVKSQIILLEIIMNSMLESLGSKGQFDATKDMKYLLFTRQNPQIPQYIVLNDNSSLLASHFDPERQTRVIIHGWVHNATYPIMTMFKDSYLQKADVNVISVDWYPGAKLFYFDAKDKVVSVGQMIAKFVDFLCKTSGQSTSMVYLIGMSLGAHAAGIAGRNIKSGRIPTIFGLDPAGPGYKSSDPDCLKMTDGDYVETIRSCASVMGITGRIGNADFYANEGTRQPGCEDTNFGCMHMRAFHYFNESLVSSVPFKAAKCSSWSQYLGFGICNGKSSDTFVVGGEPSQPFRNGSFQFVTNSQSPFADN